MAALSVAEQDASLSRPRRRRPRLTATAARGSCVRCCRREIRAPRRAAPWTASPLGLACIQTNAGLNPAVDTYKYFSVTG